VYNNSKSLNISLDNWMNSYIIKLMKDPVLSRNNLQIQNCLILLVNLFFAKLPDRYHGLGKAISELTEAELEQLYLSIMIEINR